MVKYYEKNSLFLTLLKKYEDIFDAPEDEVIVAYNYEGEEGFKIASKAPKWLKTKSK